MGYSQAFVPPPLGNYILFRSNCYYYIGCCCDCYCCDSSCLPVHRLSFRSFGWSVGRLVCVCVLYGISMDIFVHSSCVSCRLQFSFLFFGRVRQKSSSRNPATQIQLTTKCISKFTPQQHDCSGKATKKNCLNEILL